MNLPTLARAALLLLAPLAVSSAFADSLTPAEMRVLDRTSALVERHFFSADLLPRFRDAVDELKAESAAGDAGSLDTTIDAALASLGMSHTGRYTPDEVDYYELADVFRYSIRRDARRLFPPEGEVAYEGIGIASKSIGGRMFVTDVYDGGPADDAGVLAGDEILSVNGEPFAEIASFSGKAGEIVQVALRRTEDSDPVITSVKVEKLQPEETFLEAISESIRVVERGGRRIGVVHLWMYTSDEVAGILARELGGGRLADVDGLILDLRSRWGGAPADAAEMFVGDSAPMTMTGRDGETRYVNTRWSKPIVAVIDEGSRSGMEILAYGLKANGIPLVGTTTAKAVVAGTAYLLPDDSLLLLAVSDVHVDGKRLEGRGVDPDIVVPFDVRYAAGADPQMDAAMAEMERLLEGEGAGVN
jgi:carboxyl-terminal processing protease